MSPSLPPPPSLSDPPPAGSSRTVRVGTAAFTAACASLAAAAPAALRVAPHGGIGVPLTWLALAGAATPGMFVAVLVLRRAQVGVRAFAGDRAAARLLALSVWLGVLFGSWFVLAAALKATTHHHALAGVTFAVAATLSATTLLPFASQLASQAERWEAPLRRALIIAAIGIPLLLFCSWIVHLPPSGGKGAAGALAHPSIGGEFIDALAVAITAGFAARRGLLDRRPLALAGPPLSVLLALVGISLLHTNPLLLDAARAKAPLLTSSYDLCSR